MKVCVNACYFCTCVTIVCVCACVCMYMCVNLYVCVCCVSVCALQNVISVVYLRAVYASVVGVQAMLWWRYKHRGPGFKPVNHHKYAGSGTMRRFDHT